MIRPEDKEEKMDQSFRDSVGTIDEQGKRKWIYPKKPTGPYYRARTWVSIALLTLLFTGPFIRIGDHPLLLLNILERKFVIFGQVFWPQDFHLFVLAMIAGVVFVVIFTVVFGRLFCGWVCPQTIFMEMLFRKIEYWIEGDYKHQKKLDKMPWNAEKIRKKGLKHFIFLFISFLIANTFLAYIIGSEALLEIITDNPANHLGGLAGILIFTGVFYFVFSWFREQVCLVACPYGRLQGVILDRNSIVVAYDYVRGEHRAKVKKGENRKDVGKGDCIDCHLCVDVCPTGIDIRNGTQLECVNCTACMDVCDNIMEKVNQPKGLIRYASEAEIADNKPFRLTGRAKAYSGVLGVLIIAIVALIYIRSEVETIILRSPGELYQERDGGVISNIYDIKVINKTSKDLPLEFQLIDHKGEIEIIGGDIVAEKEAVEEGKMFIHLHETDLDGMKTELEIGVFSGDKKIETVEVNFLGPI